MTLGDWLYLRIKQGLIVGAITLLLYLVIDTTFGFLYTPKPYASSIERLNSPSYINEPYFSERFLAESFTQPGGWLTPEGTRLVLPKEFHGDFFNVDVLEPSGMPYRRTINPDTPAGDPIKILLLGGSTIYNSEVPDEYTVASQLSGILTDWQGRRYMTFNAGVTSVSSLQEIDRLKVELQNGLRPDIVISYGGVNDVLQGIYFGNPDGVMFENSQRAPTVTESNLKSRVKALMPAGLMEFQRKVRAAVSGKHIYQALMEKQRNDGEREAPIHMKDENHIRNLVVKAKKKYLENMMEGQRLSREFGFKFISVLQPHLYAGQYANDTPDIKLATKLEDQRLPLVDVAFARAYPALREAVGELNNEKVVAHDCSNIFLAKQKNIFLDSHHVNSVGNKMIACALASLVIGHVESGMSDENKAFQECSKILGCLPACG